MEDVERQLEPSWQPPMIPVVQLHTPNIKEGLEATFLLSSDVRHLCEWPLGLPPEFQMMYADPTVNLYLYILLPIIITLVPLYFWKKKNPHEQFYFPNDPRYLIRIKKIFSRVLLEKIVNTNVNVMTGRQLCKYCPLSLKKIFTDG